MKKKKKNKKKPQRKSKWLPIAIIAVLLVCIGAIVFSGTIMRKLFPLRYGVEVARAAETYNLDKRLVYAVIKVESDFVPDAVSPAGAAGLMQIMPDTGEWVMWRLGEKYDASRITEPEYNINIGCYLLSYLIEHYDGNLDFAIAAYNAGSGKVDGWLNDPQYYDGVTLNIPYNETSNYLAKVNYAYEKYKNLYD